MALVSYACANRDERQFADPDAFRIDRREKQNLVSGMVRTAVPGRTLHAWNRPLCSEPWPTASRVSSARVRACAPSTTYHARLPACQPSLSPPEQVPDGWERIPLYLELRVGRNRLGRFKGEVVVNPGRLLRSYGSWTASVTHQSCAGGTRCDAVLSDHLSRSVEQRARLAEPAFGRCLQHPGIVDPLAHLARGDLRQIRMPGVDQDVLLFGHDDGRHAQQEAGVRP